MTDSVSPHKLSRGREIPTRKVTVNDASQLPSDYCTTPGGTLFSTTPGGTRLIYERAFLLRCRDSPLAKSPPLNMEKIPGVTAPGKIEMDEIERENGHKEGLGEVKSPKKDPTEEQFAMDI